MVKEKIICSAIWYKDGIKRINMPLNINRGLVVCGFRHNHCFFTLSELFPNHEYMDKTEQGFITSFYRFVDRKTAAIIALESGQIQKEKNELFSEDLY